MNLTAHIRHQNRKTACDLLREACRLISACSDPHRRALAMVELRRMQMLAGGAA